MQESGSPRLLALMVQAEALQAAEEGLRQAAQRQTAALQHQAEPAAEVRGGFLPALLMRMQRDVLKTHGFSHSTEHKLGMHSLHFLQ